MPNTILIVIYSCKIQFAGVYYNNISEGGIYDENITTSGTETATDSTADYSFHIIAASYSVA
ncbi:MAG: hypothetical protein Kow00108_10690 [Calditrichia bacterium]